MVVPDFGGRYTYCTSPELVCPNGGILYRSEDALALVNPLIARLAASNARSSASPASPLTRQRVGLASFGGEVQ
jgi:hypothetical protein